MATLLPASLCSDSVFLPPPRGNSNCTVNCTRLHCATVVIACHSRGEGQHIRQLFCLEDSIIPFSGISSSIIILIIAFDPQNYQSLKLMTISLSATNSWAFTVEALNHATEVGGSRFLIFTISPMIWPDVIKLGRLFGSHMTGYTCSTAVIIPLALCRHMTNKTFNRSCVQPSGAHFRNVLTNTQQKGDIQLNKNGDYFKPLHQGRLFTRQQHLNAKCS